MIQFYLLSVLLNIVAGYALYSYESEPRGSLFDGIRLFMKDQTVRLIMGILTFTVGFFKLLTVMRGDVPVVGDLLPSVAGMAVGVTLLLEFYRATANVSTEAIDKLDKIFIANRRLVGIVAMASGLVHFLFANVLFL
ncbi:MAG TPA: hypothetical protein DCG47_02290 [Spirochaetaceae bacterium]|jgi:hypothetical protein|nr:hypothetical protein [Spirochaetaceae bacterium]